MAGGSGREIARIPLGDQAERRYGAPYWSIHRGDLQAALVDAANDTLDVTLELGVRVEEFAAHVRGVSVLGRRGSQVLDERGIALIGADGIWSTVAKRLHNQQQPTFRASHRLARPRPGRIACQPNFVSPSFISGSATTRIWSTTR